MWSCWRLSFGFEVDRLLGGLILSSCGVLCLSVFGNMVSGVVLAGVDVGGVGMGAGAEAGKSAS